MKFLRVLRQKKLYGNQKKCNFCKDRVVFLSYVVSHLRVEADKEKVRAL